MGALSSVNLEHRLGKNEKPHCFDEFEAFLDVKFNQDNIKYDCLTRTLGDLKVHFSWADILEETRLFRYRLRCLVFDGANNDVNE